MKKLLLICLSIFMAQITYTAESQQQEPSTATETKKMLHAPVYIPVWQNKELQSLLKAHNTTPDPKIRKAIQERINRKFPTYKKPIEPNTEIFDKKVALERLIKERLQLDTVRAYSDPTIGIISNSQGRTVNAFSRIGETNISVVSNEVFKQIQRRKNLLDQQIAEINQDIIGLIKKQNRLEAITKKRVKQ